VVVGRRSVTGRGRAVSSIRVTAALLLLLWWTAPVGAGEVTLYRDSWGVPHIFADSQDSAAFGHGYAQAEDRLDDLLGAYLLAVGRGAGVFGEAALATDVVARIARHEEISRERYPELAQETRSFIESYVAGVHAYMDEHPDSVPAWAERPQPYHVVALFRAFAWAWPWGQARGDLERAGSHVSDGRGSNQWVVGPGRSAEGVPIALIDPHLRWRPVNRFYEAHLHGGDLDFYGFSIVGTPVMALGHTDVHSLGLTTGGPDCADVYEERIHPEDPLKYEYDGAWRAIEVEEIAITVKTAEGTRTESVRVERTHHGPILERRKNRAFAVRTGYDREIGLIEQWLRLARARNLGEFLNAMRANQALPQNVMYADVFGNIYYVRAGRVPRRPDGYEWDRPVPGWTSATEWQGIHPLSDLVQILNPPGGFMQNCNVSPGTMMPSSPLTADRYPTVVYNERNDRSNSRGRRALELLAGHEKVTVADALRFAMDTRVPDVEPWQAALKDALGSSGKRPALVDRAGRLILGWDGFVEPESLAAPLFRLWMRACREDDSAVPRRRIASGESLSREQAEALVLALERAATSLEQSHGRVDVAWGDLHRVGRGDRSWPVGGCRDDGLGTLRSVRYGAPGDDGVAHATGGQICPTVVVLREGGVVSFSAPPFGQSDDPDSPHYTDQTEKLFSRGRLKPTWYDKTELLKHLRSERTLSSPAIGATAAEGL